MLSIKELKTHIFIIMGTEHYNPLGVVRSLGENGIKPILIVQKSKIRTASLSKYCKKTHYVNNNQEALDVLLKNYGNETTKPFVIPCEDSITEVLDKNYELLKDKFYVNNAGSNGRISEFTNKRNLCELARKHGCNIAKSWPVKKGEMPKDIEFPIITKPMTSYPGWKKDYYVCNNEEELIQAYSKITGEEILLQQYIQKVNELCLDGCVVNKGKAVFVAIASTYTYTMPDSYPMEMEVKNFRDDKLRKILGDMFSDVCYEGIFSVEFMIDKDNKLWFLEINFRNSTWSWASTRLGMNLPILWANGMITGQIDVENATKQIPEHYIALSEAQDFRHRVLRLKLISFSQWLKGVLKANCHYLWYYKDPLPGLNYWFCLFFRFISKRIKK